MARDDNRRWQPPSRLESGARRWGWQEDIIGDGERWLQSQPFWSDLARAEAIIRGEELAKADENRSDLTSNRLKRIGREMVAAISDVRYPDDVWTSDNKSYADTLTMFSKLARAVWYEARAPYSFRRATQWAVSGGNSYFWPVWRRRRLVDPGSMGLCFDTYGPRDVIPFMLDEQNWQETYAVTCIKMVSIAKAHWMFPLFQDKIKPIGKRRMRSDAVSARMAFIQSLRGDQQSVASTDQVCEVRYTMVRDLSFNERGNPPIPMGDAGTSWAYVVPAVGDEIPGYDVHNGERVKRLASIDDARLYPNMRLMISISGVNEPVYDGPYWHWHGMFPPRFMADDWVTEPMGFGLFRDVYDLERSRQFVERAIDMKIRHQCDPGMKYDNTRINAGTAETVDPWQLRARLGIDGDVDKVIDTIIPAELMKVGAEPFEWIKYIDESQDFYMGTNQLSALAKAKMSTGQEGADDLLRIAGPIVRDVSAGFEMPFADVLEMEKYDTLQFFDTARVMSYVGPDGVTPETFDFDPKTIVPATLPGEDPTKSSLFSRMERAKHFARQLRLTPVPGYLHGIPQTAQKLLLLQGSRAGLPISPQRILKKVFGIENAEQEIKEWQDFRQLQLELAEKVKQEGISLGMVDQNAPTGGGGKGQTKGGRPASGHKAPAARTKGSAEGPRAVISESG